MKPAMAALAMLAACAHAQAQLVNENLLTEMPAGYKIDFRDKKNNMLITEMVPAAETVNNWTEMVTVQVFLGMKDTPDRFRDRVAKGWAAGCAGSGAQAVAGGAENGYPTLTWMLSCPLNPGTGKPEITWMKAIQGNDSFYVVQKAFKFPPSAEQLRPWLDYLKKVAVCDSRLPDRACPPTRP